ncbi:hypothetical protein L9F63_004440, partial [Diploptera punctata]
YGFEESTLSKLVWGNRRSILASNKKHLFTVHHIFLVRRFTFFSSGPISLFIIGRRYSSTGYAPLYAVVCRTPLARCKVYLLKNSCLWTQVVWSRYNVASGSKHSNFLKDRKQKYPKRNAAYRPKYQGLSHFVWGNTITYFRSSCKGNMCSLCLYKTFLLTFAIFCS